MPVSLSEKKRIELEILGGFLMQLLGDNMNNVVKILNTKYNTNVKVGCALDWTKYQEYDRLDYYNTLKYKLPKTHLGALTPHYDKEQCAHWVYYDENANKWDSWNLDRQVYGCNQYCQTHALLLAYFPQLRDVTTRIKATIDLIAFWEQNLLYILERVNKTDLDQNIYNLIQTNKEETGQKQKFGTSIINKISQMIDNKKFNDLTQYIINTIDTPENIKVMSEWT